jgi:hypothetical protein
VFLQFENSHSKESQSVLLPEMAATKPTKEKENGVVASLA